MTAYQELVQQANALMPEVVEIRRTIHKWPELGRNEKRTQALILEVLKANGIPARVAADTGVIADLPGGHDGPVVALRADIDALPIKERTGLPYASQREGIMHACGHDMHTSALLGAAMLLKRCADTMHGTVRLIFQPDEEGDGGADRMIGEGAMDGISAVFGMHVDPDLPSGSVGICPGAAYAASNPFDIALHGASAHGAEPHLGRDVLPAACAIVEGLQSIRTRMTSPLTPAVITVGALHAGTARNILAQEAQIQGIIRCYGEEIRAVLADKVTRLVKGIAAAHGLEAEVNIVQGYSGVVNDEGSTRFVENTATELLGAERVHIYPPTLTTEDFGSYLRYAPGTYWHLGVCLPGQNCMPLHNPGFCPDETALSTAVALHCAIALGTLSFTSK